MVVEKTVELARSIGLKTLVILSLSSMLGLGYFPPPCICTGSGGPGNVVCLPPCRQRGHRQRLLKG